MNEEPTITNYDIGWSNAQAGVTMAVLLLVCMLLVVVLLYLRMGDVTTALQQQSVTCLR